MSSGVRLRVHRLINPWSGPAFLLVGVEVDRRDGDGEARDAIRIECRVAHREHATFADSEQRNLVHVVRATHELDALVQIAVDVILESKPAVGAGRMPPVDGVEIHSLR
jgi:hypothetical protein